MRGVSAIVKKEFRSYFYSPIAYILFGLFLCIMGSIFGKFLAIYGQYAASQEYGAPPITLDKLTQYLYQNMSFVLCFLTPMVTMKLFAEERRQQTYELMLTVPIKTRDLVLGKFIGAFGIMSVMVALSFLYAFIMIYYGNPDVNIIATTYLGVLFSVACYIGIGCFISTLTSSQAIAAVATYVVLLFLWLIQAFAQGVTWKTGPIEWGPFLGYLSPLGHFNNFAEGLIDSKDIVYFLTFIALSLFFTHRVVESHRWR